MPLRPVGHKDQGIEIGRGQSAFAQVRLREFALQGRVPQAPAPVQAQQTAHNPLAEPALPIE